MVRLSGSRHRKLRSALVRIEKKVRKAKKKK